MNNNKINWLRKLTSRKFWVAVAAMVTGYIITFGGDAQTAETVAGCIMSTAAVIAYIVGEGLADSASQTVGVVEVEKEDEVE